jgi:capsular polysaccharide biosynthesis protein
MNDQEVIMEEIQIRELFHILWKRKLMILFITIISVVVSAVLSFYVIAPKYEATTTLLVNKKQTNDVPVGAEYNEILANQALVKTYNEIIKSRSVASAVIDKLHLNMTTDELDKLITVNSVNQSQVFSVTVTYTNPHKAVEIANAIADTFKEKVVSLMQVENVQIVDPAIDQNPPVPVSPKKTLNIAIAFVLGLMVSIGIAFLLEYMDNTIKTEEDIHQILELPVLGTIARMEPYGKKNRRKRFTKKQQVEARLTKEGTFGA